MNYRRSDGFWALALAVGLPVVAMVVAALWGNSVFDEPEGRWTPATSSSAVPTEVEAP